MLAVFNISRLRPLPAPEFGIQIEDEVFAVLEVVAFNEFPVTPVCSICSPLTASVFNKSNLAVGVDVPIPTLPSPFK